MNREPLPWHRLEYLNAMRKLLLEGSDVVWTQRAPVPLPPQYPDWWCAPAGVTRIEWSIRNDPDKWE